MKKAVVGYSLGLALAMSCQFAFAADKYVIDPQHTYPNFSINHLGFSTMHGRFNDTKGSLTMDKAAGTGSVDIEIDVASVDTGFKKRDDHLRSPDFFNAVEYPKMTYKSTKVKIVNDTATVEGNLTIMGVTKPVTLNVNSIKCGTHPFKKKPVCGFDATGKIKRSEFGIKYALPAVGDEVTLNIEVEAFKE